MKNKMPQKISMLEKLAQEKEALERRRDIILDQVDMERNEMQDEYPNPVIEDLLAELQTLVDNIFHLENTIRTLKEACKKSLKKVGCEINVGDCVVLASKKDQKQYFIAGEANYVNPTIGIISSNSPIAQQILSRKFGDMVGLKFNGSEMEYKLMPY